MSAEEDVRVKVAVYRHFADTAHRPEIADIEARTGLDHGRIRAALARLRAQRLLLLEPDGETIRMAPPFSGVSTVHQVDVNGISYSANCAWDAFGVVASLQQPGRVRSECGQTGEPLEIAVGRDGPEPSSWLFHCLVPAAQWWSDLVFT